MGGIGVRFVRYATRMKHEEYPDLLRQRVGAYFEKDGLCFAPLLETTAEGACVLAVYFQNRREGRAVARVQLLPPRRLLRRRRRRDLPAASIPLECPGGAFGVVRAPLRISPTYRSNETTFDVAAEVLYPDGGGEIVRPCAGVPVASPTAPDAPHPLLRVLLMLPRGVLDISSPARATLTIPQGLTHAKSATGLTSEILWLPQMRGGEDVAQRRAAA